MRPVVAQGHKMCHCKRDRFDVGSIPIRGIETFYVSSVVKVSRCNLQNRQREPSVKKLHSPVSAEFWRYCVLNSGIQRRAFASTPQSP